MIIMDYGENPRVNVMTNHSHAYGTEKQQSYVKFEGSKGAIQIRAGLNMNYPDGVPDRFEYILLDDSGRPSWQTHWRYQGSWFPEAFIGTMASLMRFANGESQLIVRHPWKMPSRRWRQWKPPTNPASAAERPCRPSKRYA